MQLARHFLPVFMAFASVAQAHVGSPNAYYEGPAGPYSVRVVVRPPTAVPGLAEVTVTVDAADVERVTVLPAPAMAETALPPPDIATPVDAASGVYSAELWIMQAGAYAIRVGVHGAAGAGEAIVPINAVNRAPAAIPLPSRFLMMVLGVLLLGALFQIVAVAVRDSTLPDAAAAGETRRRRARAAGAAALLLGLAAIGAGWSTWRRYDRAYRSNQLFTPLAVEARAELVGLQRRVYLTPALDERGVRAWPRLATDHGKLMHTFLLREPELDAFAHVHPKPAADGTFQVIVPPLPAGDYRLYADITDESGLSQTLTTRFALPPAAADGSPDAAADTLAKASDGLRPDPDDSWTESAPFSAARDTPTLSSAMAGGLQMVWENPAVAGDMGIGELRFAVLNSTGQPARLVPYMGMLGHAAVRRGDGAVFAHLHPVGSISMASQEVLARRGDPNTVVDHSMHGMVDHAAMDHSMHGMEAREPSAPPNNRIGFPFQFPRTGPYRIWVQVKVGNEVLTGVFDAKVTAADGP